ncbi:hypothetical protein EVAR_91250_1 [Eumeta japonica]|uniref:Uncharacterized protein n=1 Tax=Eumeta variegata TaxID=151549 RepID=A0A4C2A0H6_EUMVA|nr:hypothetical protein EVAR_91250_1 [Eumeta japonica]
MCIRTVLTYASPVFAHAASKALHRLQTAPGRVGEHQPVTVPGNYAIEGFHMPRRWRHFTLSHQAVGLKRSVSLMKGLLYFTHTLHAYGREGVRDRHFTHRKWNTKKFTLRDTDNNFAKRRIPFRD